MPLDHHITNPEPLIQSDIDLVRDMNCFQKELKRPFDAWPSWAKDDAQRVANYRRRILCEDLQARSRG
jgi:hypothetical protein